MQGKKKKLFASLLKQQLLTDDRSEGECPVRQLPSALSSKENSTLIEY